MGGGLLQLVAYGAQDVYLSGSPQITFFKVVYRRHTNFSMESIEQVFNGSADWGRKVTAQISRNGDLISKVYLQVELPDVTVPVPNSGTNEFRWLNWLGHNLIESVEIEIGGQRIDKHYGTWLHIWNELTQTAGHQLGYANMVGNVPTLTTPVSVAAGGSAKEIKGQTLYIPLQFWFCRNAGLALPLIALQYHEVRFNLELAPASKCCYNPNNNTPVPSLKSASLFVDYIYLDTDERRRFAQSSHEYLIEQLQFTGDESTSTESNRLKLNFNHPVKELVWVTQKDDFTQQNPTHKGAQPFNFTDAWDPTYSTGEYGNMNWLAGASNVDLIDPAQGNNNNLAGTMPGVAAGGANMVHLPVSFEAGKNPTKDAQIQLNGHERFARREGSYFNLVQPFQHHTNVPSKGINVYSFGLAPEEHQPSGTCNMSRIDNAVLSLTLTQDTVKNSGSPTTAKVRIYAVNYNVLRVMSGMGGLAYSN
jgi:hypothetical protein